MRSICNVALCDMPIVGSGCCPKHYYRLKKYGDANKPTGYDPRPAIIKGALAYIPLGLEAKQGYMIVDIFNSHLDKYHWNINGGYPRAKINGNLVMAHHLIYSKPEINTVIDHINRVTTDNRLANLRQLNHADSVLNRGINKTNKSGINGVHWHARSKKWRVKIQRNYKSVDLGTFDTIEQAIIARKKAEQEYK